MDIGGNKEHKDIAGVILAGGRGERFGGRDKGWVECAGRPLIGAVIERFAPQVGPLALSVNRHRARYARLGYPLLADPDRYGPPATQGPLLGLLAALQWSPCARLACVPVDLPRLPADLVARLSRSCADRPAAYAVAGERAHYLCALFSAELAPALAEFVDGGGRAVHAWLSAAGAVAVDFSDVPEAFVNVNTPAQLPPTERNRDT